MIHGAHAFRVAARPSLDLSLLNAASTRTPFIHRDADNSTLEERPVANVFLPSRWMIRR
jgi:hypothetical protein